MREAFKNTLPFKDLIDDIEEDVFRQEVHTGPMSEEDLFKNLDIFTQFCPFSLSPNFLLR